MQRPLELQIDSPNFPILKDPVLTETMIEVEPNFTAETIGACHSAGDGSGLPSLLPSTINHFNMLRRGGPAREIQNPSDDLLQQPEQPIHEQRLHHSMCWLRVALLVQQRGRALPAAQAFILRPRSLLVLMPGETGAIAFRSDLSGHDVLEEIEAIEVDFPGCFRIVH